MRLKTSVVWPLVSLLLLVAGAARADDAAARRAAREHYLTGTTAYELGHYEAAIVEYEAAYALFNEPSILFNLGQTHRLAHHDEQALHFYRMYLSKVRDAPNRAEVEERIAALNLALENAHRAAAAAAEPALPPAAVAPAPPAAVASAPPAAGGVDANGATETAPPARRGRKLLLTGLVVGVAGLGLIAGGAATGALAQDAAHQLTRADQSHQPYPAASYSTYHNDLVLSGVLLGIGAAAAITGTVLAVIGARRHRISLVLRPAPTAAIAGAALRF